MAVLSTLLSLFSWIFSVIFTIFYFCLGLIIGWPLSFIFDRRGRFTLPHWIAVYWAKSILAASPFWRLQVKGAQNIKPGKNYVIVGNHQSMLDILVALAGIPAHFKFIAKKELFAIPFLGWHMALAGYIALNRTSATSGKEAMDKAKEWLDKGVSVLFFPEGTRSQDGHIKKFKMGAFHLAQKKETEILPVVIHGTGDALPKHSFYLKEICKMTVMIEKPVRIQSSENLEEAVEKIRHKMIEDLARLQKNENPHA